MNTNKPYLIYNKQNSIFELHTKHGIDIFGNENKDNTRTLRESQKDIIINACMALMFNS